MRRLGPRRLDGALESVLAGARPATPLALVQGVWAEAVGPLVAREAEPVAERDGVITVACASATWANELDLMAADLLERLGAALEAAPRPGPRPRALRFVVGSGERR